MPNLKTINKIVLWPIKSEHWKQHPIKQPVSKKNHDTGHLNTIIWTQNVKECFPWVHLEKSGMWIGMRTSIRMRIHVWNWTWTRIQTSGAGTPLNPFYPFGLLTGNEIRLESSLSMRSIQFWYPFHMSKVTPECMSPTLGDFGHNPFFTFERVIGYEYICGFVVPLWLLRHPQNYNCIFWSTLSTESLTTISITWFSCPSIYGTKSVHGNILREKIIVIYNVHTLPFNPKKAGSFDPHLTAGGGGGFHPPLGSRPRSGEKLCNLAHT